ncbi:MAG TPA: GH1 family beta-glucosidase [Polyangiaceae bacterium]|nr:GH1 family beta-glucosidase [Polyangiaceae bacterium]
MSPLSRRAFGAGFQIGVATSSYQIEGAVAEDGRSPSIWDEFAHRPGTTKDGGNGDIACDHYHRLEEDLDLLVWLGVDSYRFSIAWPRVIPNGRGAVNAKGLDFYERLVDGLLQRGIKPCATLYHWDLPTALAGGWLARDTALAFADYADACAARLGDRVSLYCTHNEPWCQAFLGYHTGLFAPGHKSFSEALLCAHHLLLSHGLAATALRTRTRSPIGLALNFMPAHPATKSPEDAAAARRLDGHFNRWFLEPALGRGYPGDMVELYAADMPVVSEADLVTIAAPLDVIGVNYYERAVVSHDPAQPPLALQRVRDTGHPRTADREIYAPGLYELVTRLHREYGAQRLVITENGAAFADTVEPDGSIHDAGRVQFLEAHLAEVRRARQEGVPVEAYYAWSLMDNFEWSEGYTLRYGVVHVDFATQKRTPKDSAKFLKTLGRNP